MVIVTIIALIWSTAADEKKGNEKISRNRTENTLIEAVHVNGMYGWALASILPGHFYYVK